MDIERFEKLHDAYRWLDAIDLLRNASDPEELATRGDLLRRLRFFEQARRDWQAAGAAVAGYKLDLDLRAFVLLAPQGWAPGQLPEPGNYLMLQVKVGQKPVHRGSYKLPAPDVGSVERWRISLRRGEPCEVELEGHWWVQEYYPDPDWLLGQPLEGAVAGEGTVEDAIEWIRSQVPAPTPRKRTFQLTLPEGPEEELLRLAVEIMGGRILSYFSPMKDLSFQPPAWDEEGKASITRTRSSMQLDENAYRMYGIEEHHLVELEYGFWFSRKEDGRIEIIERRAVSDTRLETVEGLLEGNRLFITLDLEHNPDLIADAKAYLQGARERLRGQK